MQNINKSVYRILSNAQAIFWDFDGVVINSMPIRTQGFRHVLREYDEEKVEKLVLWHLSNGGLSRYEKFRRFSREIHGGAGDDLLVKAWCDEFSTYCKSNLANKGLLIPAVTEMLSLLQGKTLQFLVSASDQTELRLLCDRLELRNFFAGILGSPESKSSNLSCLLRDHKLAPDDCWLVGDSPNDLDAARSVGIRFMGFSTIELRLSSDHFWEL